MDVPGAPSAKKPGRGPLGALPALSPSARRALTLCGGLAALSAGALVWQAVALASALVADGPLWSLAAAVCARAALAWATETVAARAAAGAKEELRAAVLDRALGLGPAWITARGPAELAVLATRGLDALDAYFTRYLPALVTTAVVPVLVGAWILVTDPTSAVLVAVTLPLIPVFAVLIGKFTSARVAAAATALERLSGRLAELVRALPVLTAFGRAAGQAAVVRDLGERYRRATMGTLRVAFLSALVLEIAASLSVALIAVGIGLRLVSGEMTLLAGLVVLILAPECYLPLRAAGAAHHASEDGVEAVRRVAEVPVPAPRRPGGARPAGARAIGRMTIRTPGAAGGAGGIVGVEVRNLRVRRRGRFAPDGISLLVRPGEVHRLDAPSGAGKSTLFDVLLGFVEPDGGEVVVDRDAIAWVPQRPAFAGRTVADELELTTGRVDLAVLASVAADRLVHRPVAELSTGERQRVAVARALTRVADGATVLLLDEPTAHLDPATAAKVMAAVRRAADGGASVLLATHRTVAEADDTAVPAVTVDQEVGGVAAPRTPRPTARVVAGAALGVAASAAGVALTALAALLIAKAATQPPILTLSVLVVGVRTFALAKGVLRYLERLVSHDAAFRFAEGLRVRLWRGLRPGRADLTSLVDDVDTVRDLVPRVLQPPLVAAGTAAAAVVLLALVSPWAGLALGVAVVVGGALAPLVAVVAERRASTALARGRREVSEEVLTLLTAAPDLIAFGADREVRAELARHDAELARLARRQAFGAGAATGVVHLALGAAVVACTAVAAGVDPLLVPLLGLVPLALAESLGALPAAAQHWGALREAHGRIAAIAAPSASTPGATSSGPGDPPIPANHEAPTVSAGGAERGVPGSGAVVVVGSSGPGDPPIPAKHRAPTISVGGAERSGARPGAVAERVPVGGGPVGVAPAEPAGAVELEHVTVGWPGAAAPVLEDVSLSVPPGAKVALVGPSGAGKSTLFALLLGFVDHSAGVVRRPGRIAWCPQEPVLVSTTLRENLRIGDPRATDARMREVLAQVGLALDPAAVVGPSLLSGGEAQRVALARALLHDADLLLLDEVTAHLDETSARDLLDLVDGLDRTVLHITHRPDEAARADLVLEVSRRGVGVGAYR
ncbi:thiol reductant ABC exporter subunit CydD [Saccharothrix algeriensis]|uniref:ATP-binding cassette subfamily C protein CydCD n=2 Tax=Saccharothrix algeriensis TaxID=173560 RepID=A0ABS2S737_9PSEU|nr:thiol reductant ABC exporter subunit CydD [Saccharothrix algeriensis]MBM7812060.1 ATP-binding cassette subfamily C protein CydCD [Saccharothrix algeriensis]